MLNFLSSESSFQCCHVTTLDLTANRPPFKIFGMGDEDDLTHMSDIRAEVRIEKTRHTGEPETEPSLRPLHPYRFFKAAPAQYSLCRHDRDVACH